MPIYIQLEQLDLKYWGEKELFKIVGQIGEPVRTNVFTKEKQRLTYPRVIIEALLNQTFPDFVEFENEYGYTVRIAVKYEWKPIVCTHCKGVGHETVSCRKNVHVKQEWVVKEKVVKAPVAIDNEGFKQVINGSKNREKAKVIFQAPELVNSFTVLNHDNDSVELVSKQGGGDPPDIIG